MNLQRILAEYESRGKVRFQGMTIRIENPRDSVRSGTCPDTGRKWSTKMTYPYGYIEGTKGVDGDEVDCFIGPDKNAEFAHIVHILNPSTGELDEDKVMLGWQNGMEAKEALLQNYDGKNFYGGMDSMSMDEFKKKVRATKEDPAFIKASKLEREVAIRAKSDSKIGIGTQVIVDGMRGQIGEVIGIKGNRYTVRFRNGLILSRDRAFVRPYGEIISGMWKDQQMKAGGQGSGCQGSNCGRPRTSEVDPAHWRRPKKLSPDEKFEVKTIPVNQLKTNSSESRLMRDPEDRRAIDRIAEKMKAGKRFAVIEVVKTRSGKYNITDGNHRYLAWKLLGQKKIPVMVFPD